MLALHNKEMGIHLIIRSYYLTAMLKFALFPLPTFRILSGTFCSMTKVLKLHQTSLKRLLRLSKFSASAKNVHTGPIIPLVFQSLCSHKISFVQHFYQDSSVCGI